MHGRRLLACTAVVLAAHGALIATFAHQGLKQPSMPDTGARGAVRLILLSRDQVAASALSLAPAMPAPARNAPAAAAAASEATPSASVNIAAAPPPGAAVFLPNHGGTALYRSPAMLDVPVRARSAPDLSMLNDLPWSGLPIRLRLFIDSGGTVVDTQVLQSAEADEVVARVRQMFLATGFTSGLVHGQPVPSYKDIEITVGTPP